MEHVNKLDRLSKYAAAASFCGGFSRELIDDCQRTVKRSFSEFWLSKAWTGLKDLECGTGETVPKLEQMSERIDSAVANGCGPSDDEQVNPSADLVQTATALLERLQSEVQLAQRLEELPSYKMPPPEEETAELNKKQLAVFLEDYWKDDIGHIKETTAEEGGHPFPLPPGFMKEEDDEEWNKCPLKALVNTPDGYIWVPSRSLVDLRSSTKRLDVALSRASNKEGFKPLLADAKERLRKFYDKRRNLYIILFVRIFCYFCDHSMCSAFLLLWHRSAFAASYTRSIVHVHSLTKLFFSRIKIKSSRTYSSSN